MRLKGFRCFADASVDLEHVTIFAGPNNAGKSAFLQSIRRLVSVEINRHSVTGSHGGMGLLSSVSHLQLSPHDERSAAQSVSFGLSVERKSLDRALRAEFPPLAVHRGRRSQRASAKLPKELDHIEWPARVEASFPNGGLVSGLRFLPTEEATAPNKRAQEHEFDHAAHLVVRMIEALPVIVIPERRDFTRPPSLHLAPVEEEIYEDCVTADLLMPRLVHWICTEPARVKSVEQFTQQLLGRPVSISCAPADEALFVEVGDDGKRRIQDLGSGVTEVLTFALAMTEYDGGLLLYEEPELHLHPTVQQRVLDLLIERCVNGPWQAIVTTHSDHLLRAWNRNGVRCVEVARDGGTSTLSLSKGRDALRTLIERLGASGANVLGARTVIWVEGPSDAIYLRFFLREHLRASNLLDEVAEFEGYTFAFFGGALLTHTRLAEVSVPACVDLFLVHPGSYIVFDSDRTSATAPLGKGYAQEFEKTALAGRVWVTQGREIENYLPDHVLGWAAHGDPSKPLPTTIDRDYEVFYDQVQKTKADAGRGRAAQDASDKEKARFAEKAVAEMSRTGSPDPLARLDLRAQLTQLVKFIRRAG